jgi:elongation factor Ts
VKDISLHIAASNPRFLLREDVPADLVAKEREIGAELVKGKPANIVDKIVDGKMEKFFADNCLLEQAFIKDPDLTIANLIKGKITELGENLVVRRFVRYAVGEDL